MIEKKKPTEVESEDKREDTHKEGQERASTLKKKYQRI